jgi:hypothetical protein
LPVHLKGPSSDANLAGLFVCPSANQLG